MNFIYHFLKKWTGGFKRERINLSYDGIEWLFWKWKGLKTLLPMAVLLPLLLLLRLPAAAALLPELVWLFSLFSLLARRLSLSVAMLPPTLPVGVLITLDVVLEGVPAAEPLLLGTPAMDAAELLLLPIVADVVAVAGAPFWPLLAGLPDGDPSESLLKNISRLLCNWTIFKQSESFRSFRSLQHSLWWKYWNAARTNGYF